MLVEDYVAEPADDPNLGDVVLGDVTLGDYLDYPVGFFNPPAPPPIRELRPPPIVFLG